MSDVYFREHDQCAIADLVKQVNELQQRELELMAQVERYESALNSIVKHEGKVCSTYEICTHTACDSSYAAWATAYSVLKLNKTPQQSLAEHDAEVVSDLLEIIELGIIGVLNECGNSYINAWAEGLLVTAKRHGLYSGKTVGNIHDAKREYMEQLRQQSDKDD